MRRIALAAALAVLAGCDTPDEQGISRSAFVATYVDLRSATVAGVLDDATRDSILQAHGTTEEELRAYIDQRTDDPDAIADTWREITDSIAAAADTVPAETDSLPPSE